MNSLLNFLGGQQTQESTAGVDGMAVLMQALGSAMRGESPHKFMKNLANSYPPLKKINLDDLMGSAQKLAKDEGKDINVLTEQLDQIITPMVKQ